MCSTVLGSRVQVLLEVSFLLNFFCSNTILADLTEWSIYGKPRVLYVCTINQVQVHSQPSLKQTFNNVSSTMLRTSLLGLHVVNQITVSSEVASCSLISLYPWLTGGDIKNPRKSPRPSILGSRIPPAPELELLMADLETSLVIIPESQNGELCVVDWCLETPAVSRKFVSVFQRKHYWVVQWCNLC